MWIQKNDLDFAMYLLLCALHAVYKSSCLLCIVVLFINVPVLIFTCWPQDSHCVVELVTFMLLPNLVQPITVSK